MPLGSTARYVVTSRGTSVLSDVIYTKGDVCAIQSFTDIALPRTSHLRPLVTNRNGNQALAILIGVIPEYSLAMRWEVQTGRFISENDVENANQVCILGANTATELFGEVSPIGQEVKLRYYEQTSAGTTACCRCHENKRQ